MIDIFDLFDIVYELFSWAWTWQLPILGLTIYPIQLGLAILIMQSVEEIIFPLDEDYDYDDDEWD